MVRLDFLCLALQKHQWQIEVPSYLQRQGTERIALVTANSNQP